MYFYMVLIPQMWKYDKIRYCEKRLKTWKWCLATGHNMNDKVIKFHDALFVILKPYQICHTYESDRMCGLLQRALLWIYTNTS